MKIPAYWWGHPCVRDVYNFGDLLTPLILGHYLSGYSIFLRPVRDIRAARIISVGSLLQSIPEEQQCVIMGTGLIRPVDKRFRNAKIYAVRGALTRKFLSLPDDCKLGDPAILICKVFTNIDRKDNKKIGIIPHMIHYNMEIFDKYKNDNRYKVIDLQREPKDVVSDILSCKGIISSSLHGLIVADSYNIPNIRLKLDGLDGGDFKFDDYYTSVHREADAASYLLPSQIDNYSFKEISYKEGIIRSQESIELAINEFARTITEIPFPLSRPSYSLCLIITYIKRLILDIINR